MRKKETDSLELLREGRQLGILEQIALTARLSIPAMLAQLTVIVMEYIDAAMVGRLGAEDSAAVGICASSTWLLHGLCFAAGMGFSVQVAHAVGAGKPGRARRLAAEGVLAGLAAGLLFGLAGVLLAPHLPGWLGAGPEIRSHASEYFLFFCLFLAAGSLNAACTHLLQSTGNMLLPSVLQVLMCILNVILNAWMIFPRGTVTVFGTPMPGLGWGVRGAAVATGLSETAVALTMLFFLTRSPVLRGTAGQRLGIRESGREDLRKAFRIMGPIALERVVMCGAQIALTGIVAPLGTVSIAANSFSITAEGICYMPGFGISSAATVMIGQSTGAGRTDLMKRLGWISTLFGMLVMSGTGLLMYLFAPEMIGLLSPVPEIRALGTRVLRMEAFAEPMYAASIVAGGVFQGTGDTLHPSMLNLGCMWGLRIPLAAFLARRYGLVGVWAAMVIELCIRGVIFLVRLGSGRWIPDRAGAGAKPAVRSPNGPGAPEGR